jgi:ATP adenylyltransferase
MKTMWAPWRIDYILTEKADECIFCKAVSNHDGLTLYKGRRVMVIMNKFPYINGHLLVAPLRHVSELEELNGDEMTELMTTIERSVGVLKRIMKPEGFNVGLNLGKVAGAGVEAHLHFHIVPRWVGDVNALTVFGEVRVVSEHLKATYGNLKPYFDEISDPDKRQEPINEEI